MSRGWYGFWAIWLAATVFLYSTPHTIALRNLLLLTGASVAIFTLRGRAQPGFPAFLWPAAYAAALLTVWLLLQGVLLAAQPGAALDNVRGDWLMPMLVAVLAAWCAARLPPPHSLRAVCAGLALPLALAALYQGWVWLSAGSWPLGHVPYAQRDYQSSVSGFLLSLLVAERLAVVCGRDSPLGWKQSSGWWIFLAVAAVDFLLRTRNGTLSFLVLALAAGLLYCWRMRGVSNGKMALLALAVPLLVAAGSLLGDSRWAGFAESYRIGWTSDSDYWLTRDQAARPPLASGEPVEESAYDRAAWARQAALAIGEHPLGLGFGRDAFGRAVALKYGQAGMVSSHSGWLDFALGAGIPGLVLLLSSAALAIRGAWRQFSASGDGIALMLAFLIGGYLLRCLLDGHLSGWRLGLFAFLCGVLVAGMKTGRRP